MAARLEAVHPVLASSDVARSIGFFQTLGFDLIWHGVEAPSYAVVRRDGVELHLQWNDAAGKPGGGDRPVYRVLVSDVDALHRQFEAAPQKPDMKPPFDSPWGTREFHMRDPDGNGLQFYRSRE